MRVQTSSILCCPNTGSTDFEIFGSRVERDGQRLLGVRHEDLLQGDEVIDGLLGVRGGEHTYPIRLGVLSMLADASVDLPAWRSHFEEIVPRCSPRLQRRINANLERLSRVVCNSDGEWNKDEMRYYDAAVDSEEKRISACRAISENYLGRTFYTRKRVITDVLIEGIEGKILLEIGCGTARTIVHLLRPCRFHYQYLGLDISFYRLVVAKTLVPEGEFVQASALDLPFQRGIADIGLSLGAIHHLPRPMVALECLDQVLADACFLALHEPTRTPKLIEGRLPLLEKFFTTYEHSIHDGDIRPDDFKRFLTEHGFYESRCHFSITPFRTLVEVLIRLVTSEHVEESVALARILHPLDAILVNTVGRLSSLLGPRSLTAIAKRKGRHPPSRLPKELQACAR